MHEASRARTVITGRVQGVGFRYFVIRNARQLGLVGWVRNCTDGAVEIVAEGDKQALQRLISKLQTGPAMAWVQNVSTRWQPAEDNFVDFVIELTAYT
ncbi:MAG: acylphosphatase [Armatimonadetes bacterium]|nr:acylphosphatase [Armatimonadota bacterium]